MEWARVAIRAQPEEEGGFIGVLKSVQNKRQASSEFLSIASLDPTPPGKGKGLRGQQLGGGGGPCSGSCGGDTGLGALAATALIPRDPQTACSPVAAAALPALGRISFCLMGACP